MTRFDIRVRRKQFTQGRIERHKNYQSLLNKHYENARRKTRGIMVLIFILIIIIAIALAFFYRTQESDEQSPHNPVSELKVKSAIKSINKTIYNL